MELELPLKDGDTVVASFTWRDSVFVVSQHGKVFLLKIDERDGWPTVHLTQT